MRRAPDPARPAALRRGRVGPRRSRHPLHRLAYGCRALWPARHDAGSGSAASCRRWAHASGLRPTTRRAAYADTVAMLTAMKKYGLIVADNGSNWYFQGATDPRWSNDMLDQLKAVPASAFQAIDESGLRDLSEFRARPDSRRRSGAGAPHPEAAGIAGVAVIGRDGLLDDLGVALVHVVARPEHLEHASCRSGMPAADTARSRTGAPRSSQGWGYSAGRKMSCTCTRTPGRQPRQDLEKFALHVAAGPQHVAGVDEQDVAVTQ